MPIKDVSGVIGSPNDNQKRIQLVAMCKQWIHALVARNDKYYVVDSSNITQAHADNATNVSQRSTTSGGKIRFVNYNFGMVKRLL